ncbi:MAG: metallophosphoesterase [Patescibacteria group bacterium]
MFKKPLVFSAIVALITFLFLSYFSSKNTEKKPLIKDKAEQKPAKQIKTTKEIVIAAAGDISCGNELKTAVTCHQEETASLIEEINPNAILTLGDNQYTGATLDLFQNYYNKSWGKFKNTTYPTPGNHDYLVKNAAGYFDYFGERAHPKTKGYYSFELGNWHLIALNSNCWAVPCVKNSEQAEWLVKDLSLNTKPCTLAYFHHPLFSSGLLHRNYLGTKDLWKVLYQNKIDIILNGHEHFYERLDRTNNLGKRSAEGPVTFIVGTGGENLYPFGKSLETSKSRIQGRFGVLKLTLKETAFGWEFWALTNTQNSKEILDSGEEKCLLK